MDPLKHSALVRVFALVLLMGLAGCIGHDDPVGVVKQPEEVDDADVREPEQPVVSPWPDVAVSGN